MGAVCLAVAPETISGDAWAVRSGAGLAEVLVADGLGHGPLAGEAARAAVDVFASQNWNGNGNGGAEEIGRASGRGRGEISGGARSFKKKKEESLCARVNEVIRDSASTMLGDSQWPQWPSGNELVTGEGWMDVRTAAEVDGP